MSDLTPQLRDEIALHFRESNDIRGGRIVRDMEEGLTVEQIASRQRTTLDNARNYVRGTEAMLRGELPTAPSMAVKAARGYRYLLGCNLSPELTQLRHRVPASARRDQSGDPCRGAISLRHAERHGNPCPPQRHGGEDCMPDMPHDSRGRMPLEKRRVCLPRLKKRPRPQPSTHRRFLRYSSYPLPPSTSPPPSG